MLFRLQRAVSLEHFCGVDGNSRVVVGEKYERCPFELRARAAFGNSRKHTCVATVFIVESRSGDFDDLRASVRGIHAKEVRQRAGRESAAPRVGKTFVDSASAVDNLFR